MLAALLVLGLLPLAALPLLSEEQADDHDPDDGVHAEGTDPGASEDGLELLDGDIDDDALPQDDGPEVTVYQLDAAPGETVLADFEPGRDMIELDFSEVGGDVFFDTHDSEDGPAISFTVGEESAMTLEFPGLSEVPVDDIMLIFRDPLTGEAFEISLNDAAMALEAVDGQSSVDPAATDAPGVVSPTDPELPDPPGPGEVDGTVDPTDPDGVDDPPGPDPTGPVLDPTLPTGSGPAGEGSDLGGLIARDGGAMPGLAGLETAAAASGTEVTDLSDGDDSIALADDGQAGSGDGTMTLVAGAPVIAATAPIQVVDGGEGDDTITGGDAAAFLFGGGGNDVLAAGEGATAAFGGAGDDALTGGVAGSYLDGGSGDDTVTGGDGDDVIEGGEHEAGAAAGDDSLSGGAGDDVIRGGFGADTLSGGQGNDVLDHLGRVEERVDTEIISHDMHVDGASDSLDGGEGDDTLIFGSGDVAAGGAGQDLFWLYPEGAGGITFAEITDFVVGEDFLRISLDPSAASGEPDVLVQPSEDGEDGLVMVNGDLVAVLRGAPGATASDVYAEVLGGGLV